MKQNKNFLAIIITTFLAIKSFGQIGVVSSYVFSSDSTSGFDESAASISALSNGCYGNEFKVFLYKQKRAFIKEKYKLKTIYPQKLTLFQNPSSFNSQILPPGGSCNNEDFELANSQISAPSAVQGWTFQSTFSYNNCSPFIFTGTNNYTVYAAPIIDPKIPGQISSYFDSQLGTTPSGHSFIKLNEASGGQDVVQMSKSFIVNPNNALFQYAYLPVIEDGSHACCDQPGFNIKVTVTNTATSASTVLICPNISVAVPGSLCSFTIPAGGPNFVQAQGGGTWKYSNWVASAIDLSSYLNYQIQIDVTVEDCTFGGHGAYVYFDAKCSPMTIIGNGNSFPAGTASITLPTCGSSGASIIAPQGLGPYSWAGIGVVPPYTTPSFANQSYTTNVSANYTLTMNPPGSCSPITRVITVSITPAPQVLASVVQAPCGGTVAVASCTAAGSASLSSTISWSSTPLTLNSGSTQATYSIGTGPVSVSITDPLGCVAVATLNINSAPPIPTLTFTNVTGSNSITCLYPSINYSASTTYTNGPVTYNWVSLSGTYTGTSVTFTNPAQYTVTISDAVTGCSSFSVFSIGINTISPTSSVSPVTQSITCPLGTQATFTGTALSPTTNITHMWISPQGGTLTSNNLTSLYPGSVGTHTFVLVNNINGCSVTKTVQVTSVLGFPTFTVNSPQNFTLGCTTKSVATINITNANSTPIGAPLSYTLLGPPTGTAYSIDPGSGPQTYTVNVPGTWTVIVHDNNNKCETVSQISIVQNTFSPNISAVVPQQTLTCYVPTTTLQGVSTNTNTSYTWSFPGSPGTVSSSTVSVGSVAATNSFVANYTLIVTDNINACKSSSIVPIYQNEFAPTAKISPLTSSLTCLTSSISLSNSSTKNEPASFFSPLAAVSATWEGPSPQIANTQTISTYVGYTPGVYTMTAVDLNNGCSSKGTATLIDNRIYPVVGAPAPFLLDCGTSTLNPTKIYPIFTFTPGYTYLWNTPANATVSPTALNTLTLSTLNTGEYKIVITNSTTGCSYETQVVVTNGALNGDFEPSSYTGYAPLTVNFTNNSSSSNSTSSITSVWSFGNGTSQITNAVSISPSTIYNNAGTYTVTMYVSKGTCLDTVVKVITVELPSKLEIPNVFTPNGDGSNDIFFLKVANMSEINALIFDRWGNKVFETNSNTGNIAWDGKNQSGKELSVGTYFYIIKGTGKDGKEYNQKGNVSLYR